MPVKITDINIACDAALDQDVIQEIGFLGEENLSFIEYEEQKDILTDISNSDPLFVLREREDQMDTMARKWFGVCECCNGTGQYMDCDPHKSRYVPCDNCNGTGSTKDENEQEKH